MSSLSQLQHLFGFGKGGFVEDPWIKIVLKGKENAKVYESAKFNKRKPVTFEILQLIGHQIMSSNWPVYDQTLYWTLSLVLFWGSFRMGELLPTKVTAFDSCTDLTWNDIVFKQDGSIVIRIKSPKTGSFPGQFIDLFPCEHDLAYCPVYYLKKLKLMSAQLNLFSKDFSPFTLRDRTVLTANQFISSIKALIAPLKILGPTDVITGHSFRFGIPSTLAAFCDPDLKSDVSIWGRWTSEAFQSYIKLVSDQKRCIFNRISRFLFNN